jgi:MFS family permease
VTDRSSAAAEPGRWAVALAGAVALAVAMGIGRFAFTPLLPMMLHDGVVDLHAASWLASANYLGYLAGALLCTFQPWIWKRAPRLPPVNGVWLLRAGLVATGVLTLGMALPLPALWPLLRFAAGVASAVVFVYTSGWCLAQLARRDAAALGGAMYTGPGAGIVISGLFASGMVQWGWLAQTGWAIFGVLAFVLVAAVWRSFRSSVGPQPAAGASATTSTGAAAATSGTIDVSHGRAEIVCLTLAYGTAGFGYIVTATFLPVIAREALPGSPWLDMFWPIFGLGVIAGALLSTRLKVSGDLRLLLAGCHVVQAIGIFTSVMSPSLAGFAIGSLLLGLPFTVLTFLAMQEVRRLRPALAASYMGLLTAMYGIGQIIGPPLVALLLKRSACAGAGFTLSLEIAASALLVGAALYLWMTRAFPMRRA